LGGVWMGIESSSRRKRMRDGMNGGGGLWWLRYR
jgi:hypothetical protein